MIRSHSVSGDLHGVQPDPVAADILRKEPEHETFVRLKISPTGMDSLSSLLVNFYHGVLSFSPHVQTWTYVECFVFNILWSIACACYQCIACSG